MSAQRKIKHILISSLFILAFHLTADAKTELGRIIQLTGDVDLTDMDSDMRIVPGIGTQIREKYKIRTGAKGYIEILLNDNTKIFMREVSVIQINNLRMKNEDPPTRIDFSTGKIRINMNKRFKGRNLLLKTNTAIIGVMDTGTDLGVITSVYETKLAIFEGLSDIASSNRNIIKSYELNKKEETSIELNMPPTEPVILPQEILDSWLDYYDVVDNKRITKKSRQESGIIDYILRKKKF